MITINIDRLMNMINESADIGATEKGGLNRLALTEVDKKMRDLFKQWMLEEKLTVTIDDFGNMYGFREGLENLPPIMFGSHLDTQSKGGRFDGILGVLAALEVIKTLNELDVQTKHPLAIVNFTNEEGARFTPPLLGSGAATGHFSKDYVYSRTDPSGTTFIEALEQINYKGKETNRLKDIKAFIELHIEQGPILEQAQKDIGIVEGILGMSWLEITISGDSGHAGPTPMHIRNEAILTTTKMIEQIYQLHKKDPDLIVTVGKISAKPDSINCIIKDVTFTMDIRHHDDQKRKETIDAIQTIVNDLVKANDQKANVHILWDVNTTHFHPNVIKTIEKTTKELHYSNKKLFSGAAHDSKYIANLAPTGMIFIPSIGGISHVEHELTLPEDIEKGTNVLLHTVLELAEIT